MSVRTAILFALTALSLVVSSGCRRRRRPRATPPPSQQPAPPPSQQPAPQPQAEPAPQSQSEPAPAGETVTENVMQAGWTFLGERKVDFKVERDVIPVTASEGRFRRLQIRVTGRPIKIHDLKVTFGDGGTFDVQLRREFKAGSESRAIDLPGGARVIRKVALVYDAVNPGRGRGSGGKAHLRLFGHP